MRSVGIVRRIDDLGRIVIPRELRRNMGVSDGTPLEMFVDEETNGLILTPYHNSTSSKIRGIAENLDLGYNPQQWEIATELKKIADRLESLND